jgi:hypothetical protein
LPYIPDEFKPVAEAKLKAALDALHREQWGDL